MDMAKSVWKKVRAVRWWGGVFCDEWGWADWELSAVRIDQCDYDGEDFVDGVKVEWIKGFEDKEV